MIKKVSWNQRKTLLKENLTILPSTSLLLVRPSVPIWSLLQCLTLLTNNWRFGPVCQTVTTFPLLFRLILLMKRTKMACRYVPKRNIRGTVTTPTMLTCVYPHVLLTWHRCSQSFRPRNMLKKPIGARRLSPSTRNCIGTYRLSY